MPLIVDLEIPYVEQASIDVDARADEEAWSEAVPLGDYVTFQPRADEEPLSQTETRLLADRDFLYCHFVAHDPEPAKVRAGIGRRDSRFGDDFVGIYVDPAGTAQRAYLFAVNPLGILMDGVRVAGTTQGDDVSWDAGFRAAGRRTDQGYEVELAIPWRAIRHPRELDKVGIMAFRHIARAGERSSWPAMDPNTQGLLVQEALLDGPSELPTNYGLDLIPELSFGWTDEGPANHRLGASGVFPGLTIRAQPGPSATVLGTFNPDFSQVESDATQIDVNQRYALYLQEKRPFFLDGSEWFRHPLGDLVYTRSMRVPLGGARATVESNRLAAAGLYVLDALPGPSVSEGGGWTERQLEGETASAAVLRARASLAGDGQVGLLLSDKSILGTPMANRVGGADVRVRLTDGLTANASAMGSWTGLASGRSISGPAGSLRLAWSAKHPFAGTWANAISPGFRAENGYVTAVDRIGGGSWAGLNINPPSKAVPKISLTPFSVWYAARTSGQLRDLGMEPNLRIQLGNGASVEAGSVVAGEAYEDEWLSKARAWGWVGGPWTSWLWVGAGASTGSAPLYDELDPREGRQHTANADLTFQPVPALSLGGSARWERFEEGGEALYEGWVGRAKAEVFLSRSVWGRLVVDGSTFEASRGADLLLAWEHRPGSALYAGAQLGQTDDELSWGVLGKASWALGI